MTMKRWLEGHTQGLPSVRESLLEGKHPTPPCIVGGSVVTGSASVRRKRRI